MAQPRRARSRVLPVSTASRAQRGRGSQEALWSLSLGRKGWVQPKRKCRGGEGSSAWVGGGSRSLRTAAGGLSPRKLGPEVSEPGRPLPVLVHTWLLQERRLRACEARLCRGFGWGVRPRDHRLVLPQQAGGAPALSLGQRPGRASHPQQVPRAELRRLFLADLGVRGHSARGGEEIVKLFGGVPSPGCLWLGNWHCSDRAQIHWVPTTKQHARSAPRRGGRCSECGPARPRWAV